jgi:hypothetical protein
MKPHEQLYKVIYWALNGSRHTRGPYPKSKADRTARSLRSYGYAAVEVKPA